MKKTWILWSIALVLALAGCNHSTKNPTTEESDLKKVEQSLFNEDQSINNAEVPNAIEVFCKYADENPQADDAADYLFKAIDLSVNTKQNPQKSIELVNKLVAEYPDFDKAPAALFMLASYVYDEQMQDLDKARETYQLIVDEYPDSPFASDAAIAITQLGIPLDELIRMFESKEK